MTNKTTIKIGIILVAIIAMIIAYVSDLHKLLTLSELQAISSSLQSYVLENPFNSVLIAFSSMVVIYMLPLPAAALLALITGYLFEFKTGFLLVSFSSIIAATFTFLIARYIARDWITEKFSSYMSKMDKEMYDNGFIYALSIRMVPGIPFIALNSTLGITTLKLKDFILSTFIGMIPISAVLVNAGNQFNSIKSIKDILTPNILISLLLIAAMPVVVRLLVSALSKQKAKRNIK
jgi:uncharacterized membrane protein YdjX (TVP38/TMEM64 family)